MAQSYMRAFWERKRLVTLGVKPIIWLLVALPMVGFMKTAPSSLIYELLTPTSLLVVVAKSCLEIPICMVTHLLSFHMEATVSGMAVNNVCTAPPLRLVR